MAISTDQVAAALRQTAPVIALRGVARTFASGLVALAAVDLSVDVGEFVALVGPSGCGKSTLLRLAAGLDTPTAGQIERNSASSIGFVFQEPTLMPWARVAANVRLPLDLLPRGQRIDRPQADAQVAALLDTVGLAQFAQAYPRELSGGMKMRVSLARALVTEPALLLLDEPFGALDDLTRMRLDDALLQLVRTRRLAALMVTHNVAEAVYLAHRVVVMSPRPGRIVGEVVVAQGVRDLSFRTSAKAAAYVAQVHALLAASAQDDAHVQRGAGARTHAVEDASTHQGTAVPGSR